MSSFNHSNMIMLGHHLLLHHISPAFPIPKFNVKFALSSGASLTSNKPTVSVWPKNLISLAIAVSLITPLPSSAIPSLNAKSFSTTTPFSQAKNLPAGLDNGKIRACPSINPSCVSSNPKSSNFAFPWMILGTSSNTDAIQQLQDALVKTQKNVKIQLIQDLSTGHYLQAEVDGGFGRDVLEFLVKGDVVSFRAMATKVTYVYPFTTALGDSKGQEARLKQIVNELGWYAPSFDSMD